MNFKIGMLLVFFYFFFFSKKKNVSKIPAGCITFPSLFINASFLRQIHYLCRIILFFSRIHGLGTYIPISMGPLLFFFIRCGWTVIFITGVHILGFDSSGGLEDNTNKSYRNNLHTVYDV